METKQIVLTIEYIRPNAEFSWIDEKLIWLDETQAQPTEAEIEAGWVAYQAAEQDKLEAKAQAKAAAQAKLAALDLTVEDLTALGL